MATTATQLRPMAQSHTPAQHYRNELANAVMILEGVLRGDLELEPEQLRRLVLLWRMRLVEEGMKHA